MTSTEALDVGFAPILTGGLWRCQRDPPPRLMAAVQERTALRSVAPIGLIMEAVAVATNSTTAMRRGRDWSDSVLSLALVTGTRFSPG